MISYFSNILSTENDVNLRIGKTKTAFRLVIDHIAGEAVALSVLLYSCTT